MQCDELRRAGSAPESVLLDAACRNLEISGEAANKIGPEFRLAHSEVPWRLMISARNILIHNYDGVDPEIVWEIVEREIPALLAAVRGMLKQGAG